MPLTLTTAPTSEPASISDLKLWLGYGANDQDSLFDELIRAARMHIENRLWRQLVTATYTLTLDGFPRMVYLPRPPFQNLTSIQYVDANGDTQTLSSANYQVSGTEPAIICEAYNKVWPVTRSVKDAVTLTFVSGYGTGHSIPEPIRHAILMTAASWWQAISCGGQSSQDMPQVAKSMVEQYAIKDQRMLVGV